MAIMRCDAVAPRGRRAGLAAGIACAAWAAGAHASMTLGFTGLTNSNAYNTSLGITQLSVAVDGSGGSVSFTLKNAGPWALSATDLYFDDDGLLGAATVTNAPGTAFAQTVSPASLPGAALASPAFVSDVSFGAGGTGPLYFAGVNPGESVTMTFAVKGNATVDSVYSAIAAGALRVGVQVKGTEAGGQDSLINSPVPAPGAIALCAAGILAIGRRR